LPVITAAQLDDILGLRIATPDRNIAFSGLPELRATRVESGRRREILGEVETIIAERRFRVVGENDDQGVWTRGWGEVAEALARGPGPNLDALKPQYFHRGVELRLLGDYWLPQTDYFEYWLGIAVRRALMLQAFPDPRRILELGCGTGMNLILAAELFPQAGLAGSDWVRPSLDILRQMGRSLGREVDAILYDMLSGKGGEDLPIDGDTDVLTVHALEQIGSAAPNVVELLLRRRPRRVLHVEPILEFYDRTDPYDDIAARYHLARGYVQGLSPALERGAAEGRLEILSQGRVKLGNLYHEAYSFISWQPL
jgi:SAM-dependent methyltransferase